MDKSPLVNETVDDGEMLVRNLDKFPVKIAFWLNASEGHFRYLYIASDAINGSNFDLAYGEILRLIDVLGLDDLNPFRVKVISGDHPLAQAATAEQKLRPGKATRLGEMYFGGVGVDDVYIYPSPQIKPVF